MMKWKAFAPGVTTCMAAEERDRVRYLGTRQALIAAGVARAQMFPRRGHNRRYLGRDRYTQEYFAVTRREGDLFLLSRWVHWNNPAEGKKALAKIEQEQQEQQAKQEALRKYREENAARRSQTETPEYRHDTPARDRQYIDLARSRSFIKTLLQQGAALLRAPASISPVLSGKIVRGEEWARVLERLAEEIGEAAVEHVSLLKVVPIRPSPFAPRPL